MPEFESETTTNVFKGLQKSNALITQYILETSVYPHEHPQLKELKLTTVEKYKFWSMINVPTDEGQVISMLLKIMNAKKTLEIGVFIGYSLLSTALAVPEDAEIIAVDPDKEAYEIGLPFIKKTGVEHKINFIQSEAFTVLNDLLAKQESAFDFVFVDADKENSAAYHQLIMKLIKVGGIIGYNNTLWFGSVGLSEDDDMEEFQRMGRSIFREFNSLLAYDPRIELLHISIGDEIDKIC